MTNNLPVDDFIQGMKIYGNIHEARQYEYEIQYYHAHGKLPEDCVIIKQIEVINGRLLIIHHDTTPNDA